MISVSFQGKPFSITVIQVIYAPTSNTKEAEVEQFYEDLQDLVELTPKRDVLFIIGDWNAKVGSQETHGVTGKFGLGIQNEAGQRLIEFCQENALVIADTLFQQHKATITMVNIVFHQSPFIQYRTEVQKGMFSFDIAFTWFFMSSKATDTLSDKLGIYTQHSTLIIAQVPP